MMREVQKPAFSVFQCDNQHNEVIRKQQSHWNQITVKLNALSEVLHFAEIGNDR